MNEIESKLIEFARWAISEHREDCADLDGSTIQDKLEELGLTERVTVAEPCGEFCHCAEYHDVDEWPVQCIRLVDGVMV